MNRILFIFAACLCALNSLIARFATLISFTSVRSRNSVTPITGPGNVTIVDSSVHPSAMPQEESVKRKRTNSKSDACIPVFRKKVPKDPLL